MEHTNKKMMNLEKPAVEKKVEKNVSFEPVFYTNQNADKYVDQVAPNLSTTLNQLNLHKELKPETVNFLSGKFDSEKFKQNLTDAVKDIKNSGGSEKQANILINSSYKNLSKDIPTTIKDVFKKKEE